MIGFYMKCNNRLKWVNIRDKSKYLFKVHYKDTKQGLIFAFSSLDASILNIMPFSAKVLCFKESSQKMPSLICPFYYVLDVTTYF